MDSPDPRKLDQEVGKLERQIGTFRKRLDALDLKRQETRRVLTEAQSKLSALRGESDGMQTVFLAKQEQLTALLKQVKDMENEQRKLVAEQRNIYRHYGCSCFEDIDVQIGLLERELETSGRTSIKKEKRIMNDIKLWTEIKANMRKDLNLLGKDITEARDQQHKVMEQVHTAQQALDELRKKKDALRMDQEHLRTKKIEMQTALSEIEADKQQVRADISSAQTRIKQIKDDFNQLVAEYDRMQEQLKKEDDRRVFQNRREREERQRRSEQDREVRRKTGEERRIREQHDRQIQEIEELISYVEDHQEASNALQRRRQQQQQDFGQPSSTPQDRRPAKGKGKSARPQEPEEQQAAPSQELKHSVDKCRCFTSFGIPIPKQPSDLRSTLRLLQAKRRWYFEGCEGPEPGPPRPSQAADRRRLAPRQESATQEAETEGAANQPARDTTSKPPRKGAAKGTSSSRPSNDGYDDSAQQQTPGTTQRPRDDRRNRSGRGQQEWNESWDGYGGDNQQWYNQYWTQGNDWYGQEQWAEGQWDAGAWEAGWEKEWRPGKGKASQRDRWAQGAPPSKGRGKGKATQQARRSAKGRGPREPQDNSTKAGTKGDGTEGIGVSKTEPASSSPRNASATPKVSAAATPPPQVDAPKIESKPPEENLQALGYRKDPDAWGEVYTEYSIQDWGYDGAWEAEALHPPRPNQHVADVPESKQQSGSTQDRSAAQGSKGKGKGKGRGSDKGKGSGKAKGKGKGPRVNRSGDNQGSIVDNNVTQPAAEPDKTPHSTQKPSDVQANHTQRGKGTGRQGSAGSPQTGTSEGKGRRQRPRPQQTEQPQRREDAQGNRSSARQSP